MRKVLFSLFAVVIVAVPVTARQLQTPTDWKWRTDTPANAVAEPKLAPDAFYFVAMPPGWHVTMGPGGLLYPTGRTATGNFTLEAQIFLFPGDSGGDGTAKNVLRVEVGPAEVVYSANGKEIGRWPRASLQTDGAFGFRVGRGLNLHISTLDVTERLAPVPIKK